MPTSASRLEELFDKYVQDNISPEEFDEFWQLMAEQQAKNALSDKLTQLWQQRQTTGRSYHGPDRSKVFQRIMEKGREREPDIEKIGAYSIRTWRRPLAAAAALVAVLAFVYLLYNHNNVSPALTPVNTAINVQHFDHTRNLMLPDSSIVILHADSRLDFPAGFPGDTREVTLSGTAYFDIHRDPKRPFIIHTGKIRTTVLGTAFNISSDGNKVTVSVTGGKVRVENEKKVLAELTPNEQIVYNLTRDSVQTLKVNAVRVVTDWTKQDMIFDGENLASIADLLEKRYGVTVDIKSPELGKTRIVASFSGTETLDNVLETLCTIVGASYTHNIDNQNNVIIKTTMP